MRQFKFLIRCFGFAAVIFLPLFLTGCVRDKTEMKKLKAIEYEIVEAADVKPKMMAVIEERNARPFRLTYRDGNDYYAAVGYGTKPTAGYHIRVEEVCETNQGIFVKTSIEGPEKSSHEPACDTYPYIVIKMVYTGAEIAFEP